MTVNSTAHEAPLFVVSPHLDDGVFGCGTWLAAQPGSTVCTVCAAIPPVAIRTEWDRGAGFRDSTEAMRTRLHEDHDALVFLHATALHLPFFDHQYGQPATPREIAQAIADELRQRGAHRLAMPLGLAHPDHTLASDACLLVLQALKLERCIVYEEALYRALPGTVDARIAELTARHPEFELTRFEPPHAAMNEAAQAQHRHRKHAAIQAYRSQLPALTHLPVRDLDAPERFWMLTRRDG
ncbi:PIG-L family deacetylase [Paraburkholderia phosphatilytica]|uniref:PIG-L family deacetylase n=1 Tax=Paraburkholderia phosphatilytica TaxID=2282883 RepID=UPI0013DF784D|nr:PIG-L family deacetylase [Paraburkholderia phosphatilytica]